MRAVGPAHLSTLNIKTGRPSPLLADLAGHSSAGGGSLVTTPRSQTGALTSTSEVGGAGDHFTPVPR